MFSQTQNLTKVQPFFYSVMMWWRNIFLTQYSKKNVYALFCGNFGTYAVNKVSGIIIKTAEDLKIADLLMRSMNLLKNDYYIEYDELTNDK